MRRPPHLIARETAERPSVAGSCARASEPDAGQFNPPHEPPPLDWAEAVHAAEARLNEVRIAPGIGDHPVVSGPAEELASMLCAYGMLADEVDHMRTRANERPAGKQPTRRDSPVRKTDEVPSPDMAAE